VARSSARGAGVFFGFAASSSSRVDLDFSVFLVFDEACFLRDFSDFGLGVGVWRRLDFEEATDSGVSRAVGDACSSSSDFFASFALRGPGDSCVLRDSLSSLVDSSFAAFAFGIGDFFSLEDEPVFFCDSSFANFACGIAVGTFSGVVEARCFFPDFSFDASGLGDFLGFADDEAATCSDSSLRLSFSSPTCARTRLPTITPEASAVASQMRKRTTATERNRARDVINQIVKKRVGKLERQSRFLFDHLTSQAL
jgi:hypothetical protein